MALSLTEKKAIALEKLAGLGFFEAKLKENKLIWSDRLFEIHGFKPGELDVSFETVDKLIHPEDLETVKKTVFEAFENKTSCSYQNRILRHDGSIAHVFVQAQCQVDEDGNPEAIFGTAKDITEEILFQEYQKASERKMFHAQRLAKMGFWESELSNEDNTVLLSDTARDIIRVSENKISALDIRAMIPPEDLPVLDEKFDELRKNGKIANLVHQIVFADGEKAKIHMILDKISDGMGGEKFFGVIMDITERTQVEESLIKSEHMLKEAQRIANIGFFDFNFEANEYFWSPEHYKIFELDPEQDKVLGPEELLIYTHPDDLEMVMGVRAKLDEGLREYEFEHRIIVGSGKIKHVSVKTEARFADDGRPTGVMGSITDITKSKENELLIRESEEKFKALYDENPSIFFTLDSKYRIASANEYGAEQIGSPVEDLVGKPYLSLVYRDDLKKAEDFLGRCLSNESQIERCEIRKCSKKGALIWMRMTARKVMGADNSFQIMLVCEDITEMKLLSNQLAYQARHDALTGLINRYELENRIKHSHKQSIRTGQVHAICYMDLDQFKVVNDTCGHLAGDEMLRQLGALLREKSKDHTVARLGGDEFAVLINSNDLDEAYNLIESIRDAIEKFRFVWVGRIFSVAASCGLARISTETQNVNDLLRQADIACYEAKESGGNRIQVYQSGKHGLTEEKGDVHWLSELKVAMDENRLQLFAQPILAKGESASGQRYELLLRFKDRDGQIHLPCRFLQAAERYNYSTTLDAWVVDSYLNWLMENHGHLAQLDKCFINLSGRSLGDGSFSDHLIDSFRCLKVPAKKICFEITETAAIGDLDTALDFMERLSKLGIEFALDDFGSGMSSFAYLKHLPVDYLKVDGEFSLDVDEDPIDQAMMKSIVEIARVMGKKTVAEFVESASVLNMLHSIGVDYAQGYHLGRPQPLVKFENEDLGQELG